MIQLDLIRYTSDLAFATSAATPVTITQIEGGQFDTTAFVFDRIDRLENLSGIAEMKSKILILQKPEYTPRRGDIITITATGETRIVDTVEQRRTTSYYLTLNCTVPDVPSYD